MQKIKSFLTFFTILLALHIFSNLSHAESTQINSNLHSTPSSSVVIENQKLFNIKYADTQLVLIKKILNKKHVDMEELKYGMSKVIALNNKALDLAEKMQKRIKEIDDLFENKNIKKTLSQSTKEYLYIINKKKEYQLQYSKCLLFSYNAKETINLFKNKINNATTYSLLKKDHPVWKNFSLINLTDLAKIKLNQFYEISGLTIISFTNLSFILIFVLIVTLITYYFKKYTINKINNKFYHPAFFKLLKKYIYFFTIPLTVGFTLNFIFKNETFNQSLEFFCYAFFIYTLLLFCSNLIVDNVHVIKEKTKHIPHLQIKLKRYLTSFIIFLFIGHIIAIILEDLDLNLIAENLIRSVYISILTITTIGLFLYFEKIFRDKRKSSLTFKFIKFCLILFAVMIIIYENTGYHRLVDFLTSSIFKSLALFITTYYALKLIKFSKTYLKDHNNKYTQIIRHYLGIRKNRDIKEFMLIRMGLYIFTIFSFSLLFLSIWATSTTFSDNLVEKTFTKTEFLGIPIIPINIISSIIVFAIIQIIGKLVASYVARTYRPNRDRDSQIAIASLIKYVAITIAILAALIVLGINFTSITIIASALSVGIGLGLQNIANNFISGIILLIEKPIKPGDRICLDNIEGHVKRIRIRATHLITTAKEDLIIPNSELITTKIKNFTFKNKFCKISCGVGVAYGSDINLVKDLLLTIAKTYPNILQDEPYQPAVYFYDFLDSNLLFKLWVTVKDADQKTLVKSDLLYAINETFNKNNITIAYPQRDIHIKSESKG